MSDWGLGQAVIALIVIPAIIPRHWWSALGSTLRRARLTVQPGRGQCQLLSWDDRAHIPDGALHQCARHGSWPACAHGAHAPGTACWEASLGALFNRSAQNTYIPKPTGLPLDCAFLATDAKLIHAYILCTIGEPSSITPLHTRPSSFDIGGVRIKPALDPASGAVLVHVAGPAVARGLTRHEAERLLAGYPPFYRAHLPINNFRIPSPIQSAADVARGGWVVGAGLSALEPLPVYMDTLRDPKARRGAVFFRALARVRDVLVYNVLPLFPEDANVRATIAAVEYMIAEETQSGAERALEGSGMMEAAPRLLSQPECIAAMRIFNDSPRLDSVALEALRREITPILFPVLWAALRGVTKCIAYVKNPGREMDMMIPQLLWDAERVFVRGCS